MSESTEQTGPWLKWAYRYESLIVDRFDTLDEAQRFAWAAADLGGDTLSCIEGPSGEIVSADEVWDARPDAYFDDDEKDPKSTYQVDITSPTSIREGRTHGCYAWYSSKEKALAAVAKLGPFASRAIVRKAP